MIRIGRLWPVVKEGFRVFPALLFSGCLYSTHHFNGGKLLEPGRTSVTLGAGVSRSFEIGCPQEGDVWWSMDSTGTLCRGTEYFFDRDSGIGSYRDRYADPVRKETSMPKASLGYRLGIHGPWGPLRGAEAGVHLEAPTNPVSGEFDLKFGLPAPSVLPVFHSLSAGWGIGLWADNSQFLEYAVSVPWMGNALFGNYRATRLASQPADLKHAERMRRFPSRRRLIHQAALGLHWTLPDIAVVPDFLAPQINLTYPLAPSGTDRVAGHYLDDRQWDASLGFGWNFK